MGEQRPQYKREPRLSHSRGSMWPEQIERPGAAEGPPVGGLAIRPRSHPLKGGRNGK
jgi:hypothetical protein